MEGKNNDRPPTSTSSLSNSCLSAPKREALGKHSQTTYNTVAESTDRSVRGNLDRSMLGIDRPNRDTGVRIAERAEQAEQAAQRHKKMCDAVRTLLECIGDDPDREGLRTTPSRYVDTLLFLTQGYQASVENVVNNALFHEGHHELIIVKDIDIHSLCEHHIVPFSGKMHIGYIPNGTVIGLSKLARIAEMFSRRLQIQERLTRDVAQIIMETVHPRGVAVVMESSHMCMVMRGVEKSGAVAITSCVLGCFVHDVAKHREFLGLVGARNA